MASEYQTLLDIEGVGNLNPAQRTQLEGMRANMGSISGGVNLNAGVEAAQRLRNLTPGFLGGQQAQSQDYLGRLGGYVSGQPTSSAMAERIGGELGLPTLRSNVQGLENTLFNLPSTYGSATRGFDVNANQLARIIGTKQAELAPAATLARSNLQSAESDLSTRLGYAQQDFSRGLIPFQSEEGLLKDRLARETTLFSQDNERELDAIIAKLSAGVTLTEGERNRANQLAIAEKNYQNQLELQSGRFGFEREQRDYDPLGIFG